MTNEYIVTEVTVAVITTAIVAFTFWRFGQRLERRVAAEIQNALAEQEGQPAPPDQTFVLQEPEVYLGVT
jgi:hypothetical protein